VRRLFKICLLCALLACGFGAAGNVLAHADGVDDSQSMPCNDAPDHDPCDAFEGCYHVPLPVAGQRWAQAGRCQVVAQDTPRPSFHIPDLPLPPPLGKRRP
jgi:hypothetical protein